MTQPAAFLSHLDVCIRLGHSEDVVYGLLRSGRLKSIRIGRKYLISEENYAEFLKDCEVK